MGERVRYDGGHKRATDLLERMKGRVDWLPLCPEVLAGLSVPRPAMRLVDVGGDVRAREIESGLDHTAALRRAGAEIVAALGKAGACGFVFKSRSPSCAVADAPLLDNAGATLGETAGLAVVAIRAALPGLPLASDEDLTTEAARAGFLGRVAAYARRR